MLFAVLALIYIFMAKGATRRLLGIPVPLLFAAGIFTGLFIQTYDLVDEVAINLKHAYNLYHYGKFSMSPDRWIEGTVESIFYLLHTPFAWSQHSLVVANFVISLLVGLLHLPLAGYAIDPAAGPRKSTLLLCGFALYIPLAATFSSGFGNGLVSLIFLAAIGSALNGKESRSLVLSGLLPLFRPDALGLSLINAGVIAVSRRLAGKRFLSLREHALPLLLPAVSVGIYYSFYKATFGNWVPTPIFFKTIHLPMFAMTQKGAAVKDMLFHFSQGARAITLTCVILLLVDFLLRKPSFSRLTGDRRLLGLGLYVLATAPLFVFYSITHNTLKDFSFGTYSRYWVAFDLTLQLLVLAMLVNVALTWGTREAEGESTPPALRQHVALTAFFILSILFNLGSLNKTLVEKPGRADGLFAGAFTERYLPPDLTLAATELDTFGLMIERPLIDLWGYTTPEIAFSDVCNSDRVRSNPQYFLQVKPDVYWPHWFTTGLVPESSTGNFDNAEDSLSGFHHTNKTGNHLGDMAQVLAEYDLVVIQTKGNHLAYLARKSKIAALVESLVKRGFSVSRQRSFDLARFHRQYDKQKLVTYPCR